jgi:MscS family membrane protein
MPRTLLLALLAALAGLALAAPLAAADDEAENPLEPLDTSSPQAALQAFVDQAAVVEEAALEYRTNRSNQTQSEFFDAIAKTSELSDLSKVPAASVSAVVESNFASLADILMRIPLPPAEEIPDADQVAADELTRWTLPGTEITFKLLGKGDRAGAWVLTPQTVSNLGGWRQQVERLPVLVDDPGVSNWRRTLDQTTGPLIPAGIISALPDIADDRVLGSPLWKSIAAIIGVMLIVLLGYLWYRFIGRRGPEGTIRRHVFALTTPLVVIALIEAFDWFMRTQVNVSGSLAELLVLGTTIGFWIMVAWLFAELVALVVEWVIDTRFIADDRYDTHLLQLLSKVISAIGVVLIVLYGANEIGIPALGLLAGASVGGLVIGLAAQSTVENFIGGMTLYADKPFAVGDFVGFGDDSGTVEDIGPRSTRIRKMNGTQLTVPNSDIVQARISNFTQRDNALFLHVIGLRYETTLAQIEWLVEQIREGLRAHPKVEKDDDMPRVRLAEFGASSIDVEARAYVATTSVHEFMAVQEELLAMIMRRVEAAGTGMAFPSTTAYLTRDGGIEGPKALEAAQDAPADAPKPGPEVQADSGRQVADDNLTDEDD